MDSEKESVDKLLFPMEESVDKLLSPMNDETIFPVLPEENLLVNNIAKEVPEPPSAAQKIFTDESEKEIILSEDSNLIVVKALIEYRHEKKTEASSSENIKENNKTAPTYPENNNNNKIKKLRFKEIDLNEIIVIPARECESDSQGENKAIEQFSFPENNYQKKGKEDCKSFVIMVVATFLVILFLSSLKYIFKE